MFHVWVRLCANHDHTAGYLLPKVPGFLHWHDRPRVGSGPFLAGTHYHDKWGNSKLPTPVKV